MLRVVRLWGCNCLLTCTMVLSANKVMATVSAVLLGFCSQEVMAALIKNDVGRLQALFITDAEVKSLGLPATEIQRLQQLQAQAPARFQALLAKLPGLNHGEKVTVSRRNNPDVDRGLFRRSYRSDFPLL